MNLPPSVEILRKQIDAAKDRGLEKVRNAADGTIQRLNIHIESLLKDPSKFTTHTVFSEEMPIMGRHKGNYDAFLEVLRSKLTHLGYRVEQSHDGGGMYDTVVIRWDIEKKKRYGDVGPRRSDVDFPPCTGTNIY
jgi:hypothetical protein